jgi:hypothetical protein
LTRERMSISCKRLRHDGGVTGIKHKRLGIRRKSCPAGCLAHDGGVIHRLAPIAPLDGDRSQLEEHERIVRPVIQVAFQDTGVLALSVLNLSEVTSNGAGARGHTIRCRPARLGLREKLHARPFLGLTYAPGDMMPPLHG